MYFQSSGSYLQDILITSSQFIEPEIQYRIYKNQPLDPTIDPINPVHIFTPNFCEIHFNIIPHLHPCISSYLFPLGFQIKILCTFLIPIRAALPSYPSLLALITWITFYTEYKVWTIHCGISCLFTITSFILGPNRPFFPQLFILIYPQFMILPYGEWNKLHSR